MARNPKKVAQKPRKTRNSGLKFSGVVTGQILFQGSKSRKSGSKVSLRTPKKPHYIGGVTGSKSQEEPPDSQVENRVQAVIRRAVSISDGAEEEAVLYNAVFLGF